MRPVVYALLLALTLSASGYGLYALNAPFPTSPSQPEPVRSVNAVVGNEGYRVIFGTSPSADTPERLRLQAHLAYVEARLRSRPRPSLSPTQRTRRARLLDALHRYWRAGRFPRNTEVPGRSPVFIDERGRLCAVGHLIAVSAGRALAERIDARYHLASVRDMNAPVIRRWAERHGFTRRELAMIQPTYDGGGCCVLESEDETASALEVTALSASVGASIVNGVLLERGAPSLVGGTMGLVGGGASLAVGLGDTAKYPTASSVAGLTSVVLGSWSIVTGLRRLGSDGSPSTARSSVPDSPAWSVAPTTVTTVDGRTRPGVRATIQF
jgi:hypothetical protein